MKHFLAGFTFFFLLSHFSFAQSTVTRNNSYQFSLDLTKVHDDMLTVELTPPLLKKDTVVYKMPAIVPGTYHRYDFGKYIHAFYAFDKNGKILPITHTDKNSWEITGAKDLYRITYDVEDTWDSPIVDKDFVFEPAGTNIQADTNFVINNFGFFGYFDGMRMIPYVVNITHPKGFYGSTALSDVTRKDYTDTYKVSNYIDLADGPIMYNVPDTTHLFIGGADILISVYSPTHKNPSKFIADSLRSLLDAQRQYLGGTLPVKNYAFLFYLTNNPNGYKSHAEGALEHCYSSFYAMSEMDSSYAAQAFRDVMGHEFFHIVTPLSIHSKEIGNFDYDTPKMSEHLWLYEGLTEYAAQHVQVKYGIVSLNAFLQTMHYKMVNADQFTKNLSFTEMSKGCVDKYVNDYNNVYEKGALIGMCLDIRLRELSNGKYGTQDLMNDLSKKYGKDRSFDDDSLFGDIVKLTYPEIGDFFKNYVIGGKQLPYKEIMNAVGIDYFDTTMVPRIDPLGGFGVFQPVGSKDSLLLLVPIHPTAFSKKMGYKKNDAIISINGKKAPTDIGALLGELYYGDLKEGDEFVVEVKRKKKFGKPKIVKLTGVLHKEMIVKKHTLTPMKNPTDVQLKLRQAWINQ